MDQSSVIHDSSISLKFAVGFAVISFILIIIVICGCCYRKYTKDRNNNDNQSTSSSIQSFEQLYCSKIPINQIKTYDNRVIERWSSADQPSTTFYRVYMQDNSDTFYQPVTEKRLQSTIEQSKAMDYVGVEMNFF